MKLISTPVLQFCIAFGTFLSTRCAGAVSVDTGTWILFPGWLLLVLGLSGMIRRLDEQHEVIERLTKAQQASL